MIGRPRGFIENWNPIPRTLQLVDSVKEILVENHEILPLTIRQIFYMLVSNYEYDKTEKAYKRLCENLNRVRRAQYIQMSDIRDDGLTQLNCTKWDDEDNLITSFKYWAKKFRLDRQEGQETHIMVWCEAGGMAPQLHDAVEDFSIPVISSGGFDSVTTKHNMARSISYHDRVEILHIGDHDPSGVHMCSSLDEDLTAFLSHFGGNLTVTRLAVIPEQITAMNLPTAPPKKTDRRSFTGLTTQAEAIPPRTLRKIVVDAIEDRLDRDTFDAVLAEEKVIRRSLATRLEGL